MRREQTKARTKRFKIGEEEIETVREFKYLGRITSDDDDHDDLSAVRENLKKARQRWARVSNTVQEDERNAGRLPQSMRETNDRETEGE